MMQNLSEDVGLVEDGLYRLDMYRADRAPALMVVADMDVIDMVDVLLLYVQSTERVPNMHEISAYCTVIDTGSTTDNALYAGIGLLLLTDIVYIVGQWQTVDESAATDILVIYLEVNATVNEDVISSTIDQLSDWYNCVSIENDDVSPIWYGFVICVIFNVQFSDDDVSAVSDDAKNTALLDDRLTQAGTHPDEPVTLLAYRTGNDTIINELLLLLISLLN